MLSRLQRRRLRARKLGIKVKLLDALLASEVPDCGCKQSLMPVCLIAAKSGCRERRRSGSCACRPRWLPRCQLDHPGGCERRREGKGCECGLMLMPQCLSPGCDRRRRGKLCDCPRWPGDPCRHITSYAARMIFLAAAMRLEKFSPRGSDPDSGWAALLWYLWPKKYGGRTSFGKPRDLIDREKRVEEMVIRRAYGLSLWHPQDIRYPAGEGPRPRLGRNAQAFAGILLHNHGDKNARNANANRSALGRTA